MLVLVPDRITDAPPAVPSERIGRETRSDGEYPHALRDPQRSALGGEGPLKRAARQGFWCGGVEFRLAPLGRGDRGSHEAAEERVRPIRSAAELRVELGGDEPGVVPQLDDLDEPPVGRLAREDHAGGIEKRAIAVVDFETMAMA